MQENDPLVFKSSEILEKGALKLELTPSTAFFADVFDSPGMLASLSVELSFSVVEGGILLEGRVGAELNLECARCSAPVTRVFSDSFDELYPDTVECIDARGPVRETAGTLAPLKVVCSEGCKGRCPMCGADLNKQACSCVAENNMPFKALNELGKFSVKKGGKPPQGGEGPLHK